MRVQTMLWSICHSPSFSTPLSPVLLASTGKLRQCSRSLTDQWSPSTGTMENGTSLPPRCLTAAVRSADRDVFRRRPRIPNRQPLRLRSLQVLLTRRLTPPRWMRVHLANSRPSLAKQPSSMSMRIPVANRPSMSKRTTASGRPAHSALPSRKPSGSCGRSKTTHCPAARQVSPPATRLSLSSCLLTTASWSRWARRVYA
mmetsp:Transcript_5491/g.16780  ORF Transcript_5491/g.16780 Transcript_5491/m.16780 type:complete len:200 (+) Transcript_5491:245-844(+)